MSAYPLSGVIGMAGLLKRTELDNERELRTPQSGFGNASANVAARRIGDIDGKLG